jgi:hypothetical protein
MVDTQGEKDLKLYEIIEEPSTCGINIAAIPLSSLSDVFTGLSGLNFSFRYSGLQLPLEA